MTEANTPQEAQDLRKWCLELAVTEPTNEWNEGACTRQIVATAAAYEEFILSGAESKHLDALFDKAESAWGILVQNATARAKAGQPENAEGVSHLSSCALHNAPAFAPLPCDCGAL